jgi:hypothetical protein
MPPGNVGYLSTFLGVNGVLGGTAMIPYVLIAFFGAALWGTAAVDTGGWRGAVRCGRWLMNAHTPVHHACLLPASPPCVPAASLTTTCACCQPASTPRVPAASVDTLCHSVCCQCRPARVV